MPPPNPRHEPSSEELARQIADRLARSKPTTPRFSLRNSVLVGRLIAGVTALASIAVVVAGVVAGVSWLLAPTAEPHPEVLAGNVEQSDVGGEALADDPTTTTADGTLLPLVPLVFPTPPTDTTGPVDQPGPTAVTIPPATTTTTPTSTTSNPVVSTSVPTTTTQPPTTTTLRATTTTAPATTTTSPPTTTTEPSTTTTTPTSTTTEAIMTTTTRPSPSSTPGRGG